MTLARLTCTLNDQYGEAMLYGNGDINLITKIDINLTDHENEIKIR